MKNRLSLALFLCATFSLGDALASPAYPSILRAYPIEGMQTSEGDLCTPECSICHSVNPGTSGTATQPFALTLVEHGLFPNDEDSLHAALESLASEDPAVDSDGDGRADLDELSTPADFPEDPTRGGAWDPSTDGQGNICADEPRYGCGAQLASSRLGAPGWLGALIALLALGYVRRAKSES